MFFSPYLKTRADTSDWKRIALVGTLCIFGFYCKQKYFTRNCDIHLMSVSEDALLPDVNLLPKEKLPMLIKRGVDIFIMGIHVDGTPQVKRLCLLEHLPEKISDSFPSTEINLDHLPEAEKIAVPEWIYRGMEEAKIQPVAARRFQTLVSYTLVAIVGASLVPISNAVSKSCRFKH